MDLESFYMHSASQYGTPFFLSDLTADSEARKLDHVPREGASESSFSEEWLQKVIQAHPELIPIDEIEPAFRPLIPVCMELPAGNGYVDNFLITPNGGLVFIEVKLWRNAEARRKVLTQVMEYVESISRLSYADLENAVRRGQRDTGVPFSSLFSLVAEWTDLTESAFHDAVSRNLRLGRGLFIIAGDGIREDLKTLVDHVQSQAGLHFSLALIELAFHKLPLGQGYVMQPRTTARTLNIERGIIRIEGGQPTITAPEAAKKNASREAGKSLSAEEFFERLAAACPIEIEPLQSFLDKVTTYGVRPEFKGSLILRWHAVDGTKLNLGYISTSGEVWTDMTTTRCNELGILDLAQEYIRKLAEAINGGIREAAGDPDKIYVEYDGRVPKVDLLMKNSDAWLAAIRDLATQVNQRLE
tara:strand:+ start:4277 stop:5521 length:1245 start_codon:yes stop_codon:yes gene_type:complete